MIIIIILITAEEYPAVYHYLISLFSLRFSERVGEIKNRDFELNIF